MAEIKLPRLLAAAKEFNIGQDTLIDFLIGKSFPKDELKPTSKLTEAMYRALQSEFQGDKAAKMKSDQVDLPKGSLAEAKKKKEDEEILFKKEEKKAAPKKEEPVVVEEEKPVVKQVEPKEDEVVKIDAPEISSPKVIAKIDLSAIDSSTRPKKTIKKKADQEAGLPPVEEKSEEIKKQARSEEEKKTKKAGQGKSVEKIEGKQSVAEEEPEIGEDVLPVIENIKAEKIEGPRIMGKIDLPVDNDTRPVKDEKRKRKRIFIEKKEVKPDNNQNQNRGGDRRQGGGGGGNFNRNDQRGRTGNTGGGAGTGAGGRRPIIRREDKLIDEKAIQEKIRETQAKLSGGGGKGKGLKAKIRREKRQGIADAMGEAAEDNKLQVTEFISVSELANLMDVSFAEVISKCMSLGIMVSINQRLDAEVIELVASEFGFDVEFINMEKQMERRSPSWIHPVTKRLRLCGPGVQRLQI